MQRCLVIVQMTLMKCSACLLRSISDSYFEFKVGASGIVSSWQSYLSKLGRAQTDDSYT